MVINTRMYKGFKVEIQCYDGETFHCATNCFSSWNSEYSQGGYFTINEAWVDITAQIDEFIAATPSNMEELAKAIEETLVWETYEDCQVDPTVLETILSNYLKGKGIVLP